MRSHKGVAVWPMSWNRFKRYDSETGRYVPSKAVAKTDSKLFEFTFSLYDKYNEVLDKSGVIPQGLKDIGMDRYPKTFFWYETMWNPYTNQEYAQYKEEYPFQLICGRVHHSMTATQMVPVLAQAPVEGIWMPMNDRVEQRVPDFGIDGVANVVDKVFDPGTMCVGTIAINATDANMLGIRKGDLIELENPLGAKEKGRAFVTEGIRPGTIKLGFGTGGRFAPGVGLAEKSKNYTANHSALVDPNAHSPLMGMPCFADMVVKVRKA